MKNSTLSLKYIMWKVICVSVCLMASTLGSILDVPKDIKWTSAINEKICLPGNHPDSVSQKFYDCYNPDIVPGAQVFIDCQKSVYGVTMNTEANMDAVCNASADKFPRYALCLLTKLPLNGVIPSNAMPKLNACQGAVVGVPPPA